MGCSRNVSKIKWCGLRALQTQNPSVECLKLTTIHRYQQGGWSCWEFKQLWGIYITHICKHFHTKSTKQRADTAYSAMDLTFLDLQQGEMGVWLHSKRLHLKGVHHSQPHSGFRLHTLQERMFPKAENVSYRALLSMDLSRFLMKMFPTPLFLNDGSRWDHMIRTGLPLITSKFMVSSARSAEGGGESQERSRKISGISHTASRTQDKASWLKHVKYLNSCQ